MTERQRLQTVETANSRISTDAAARRDGEW